MAKNEKAVVLLSGGLDSSTVLAMALDKGFEVAALSFRYGQRHAIELNMAKGVANALGVTNHVVADMDLTVYGGSALTDDIDVPKDRSDDAMADGIPVTYVPARNTIFLAHALALAETEGTGDIFVGVNALDYSGYPDCRPSFIDAFERLANLATKDGVEALEAGDEGPFHIHAPLIDMTKADIIRAGTDLGLDYGLTWSCYDPVDGSAGAVHCGRCDSCLLRQKGFDEAGIADPTDYA